MPFVKPESLPLESTPSSAVIRYPVAREICWAALAFFGFCSGMAVYSAQYSAAIFFLPFLFMAAWFLLGHVQTRFDDQGVHHDGVRRQDMIRWEEVRYLEHDPLRGFLIFKGQSKQVVIPDHSLWQGRDTYPAMAIVQQKLDAYAIVQRTNWLSLVQRSYGARVR